MIKLHHLRIGRSIFAVWLLEEVGAEYELEVYLRHPDTMRAPDTLKAVHPLGKSPVIEDGDLTLAESGAITNYILAKYDTDYALHPSSNNLALWAHYQQWLAYPEGSVFAPLLLKMLVLRSGVDHPVITPFSDAEITLHLDHITAKLGDQDYILGEFSGADFAIAYVVSMAQSLGQLSAYPTLQSYIDRCKSRPAFQRAIKTAVE